MSSRAQPYRISLVKKQEQFGQLIQSLIDSGQLKPTTKSLFQKYRL